MKNLSSNAPLQMCSCFIYHKRCYQLFTTGLIRARGDAMCGIVFTMSERALSVICLSMIVPSPISQPGLSYWTADKTTPALLIVITQGLHIINIVWPSHRLGISSQSKLKGTPPPPPATPTSAGPQVDKCNAQSKRRLGSYLQWFI